MVSQKNKAHKPGRRAGKSAREKHKDSKGEHRQSVKGALQAGLNKMERANAAKQQRDQQRDAAMAKRRQIGAPRVVAVLPMSEAANSRLVWDNLLRCCAGQEGKTVDVMQDTDSGVFPMVPTLSELPGRHQAYWIPPPVKRGDPLQIVELARHAEAVLLVFSEKGDLDAEGERALTVLRDFGLPTLVPVVLPPATAPLKVRAASKKLAALTLEQQGITEQKVHVAGTETDYRQLVRHVAEVGLRLPSWRQQRPSLLVEEATFVAGGEAGRGSLILRGFVRALGLSANQAVHIPGAGDFQVDQITGPPRPAPAVGGKRARSLAAGDVEMDDPAVLATPAEGAREGLQRENEPDPLDAEQTWPTEEELAEAAMDVDAKKRRLPKGTSAYQAAWILDNDFSDDETEEVDLASPSAGGRGAFGARSQTGTEAGEAMEWEGDDDDDMDGAGTSYGIDDEDIGSTAAQKPTRRQQDDELQFPDEIDTPDDMPAKLRFAKFRGLRSWRSSPWDPKESLPPEYARIYAFQSMRRAEKKAKIAAVRAGAAGDGHGVPSGTYVDVHLGEVPEEAAQKVVQRVEAANKGEVAPLVAFGLLQHETRLSVLNFALKKASTFEEPLANKAPLLFVTGFRTYTARPIYSADEHGATKFKMERFLHPGQSAMATVYGPISYAPLPLLAFHQDPDSGDHSIAAVGSLRSCNPDRVVLKRVVLSGYPVRVHKKKAVVRWMFHQPDDVRWFKPLELWTKHGLRGRIREPVGTHGAMKCIFDGVVNQQDAVCTSLYKRVYPRWPENMAFAD